MDGVKHALVATLYGLRDAILGISAVRFLHHQPSTAKVAPDSAASQPEKGRRRQTNANQAIRRIFECSCLNGGIFLLSIFAFEWLLIPHLYSLMSMVLGAHSPGLLHSVWSWLRPLLGLTFGALWVLPLFLLSRVVNALWFQDIAESTFRGRAPTLRSFSKLIADTLFSIFIQALFLMQSVLVSLLRISILGPLFSLIHLSLLYSLYSFEYKWFNMGWELHRRLHFIENNWPYFLGFGLPLAILTSLSNSYFVNGCIFSILFPFFIISGNEAKPRRGLCELPIPWFQPVVWFSNRIFQVLYKYRNR